MFFKEKKKKNKNKNKNKKKEKGLKKKINALLEVYSYSE